jgi:hypothetical protein
MRFKTNIEFIKIVNNIVIYNIVIK